MRFLADMGVAVPVVTWLREQGHDAVHLRDEGLQRLPNGEIAALARSRMASVIVFRLHNTRTPHVIERLSAVLADCSSLLANGAVVSVEEGRHRVRSLPIGRTDAT